MPKRIVGRGAAARSDKALKSYDASRPAPVPADATLDDLEALSAVRRNRRRIAVPNNQ